MLTHVATTGAPDADYDLLETQFDDKEIAYLTTLIAS